MKGICFSFNFSVDGTVERGCDSDRFTCPPTATCKRCMGIGCNAEGYMMGYCISCTGNRNSSCYREVGRSRDDPVVECPISWRKPLCYVFYDDVQGTVERGCTATSIYTAAYLYRCETNGLLNLCLSCDKNYCNYFTRRMVGSGGVGRGNLMLTLVIIIVYSLCGCLVSG